MANTTPIHAGHGNWESPQFDHHNYKATSDWVAAGLKMKYLPTRKTTREALRAVRRTLLGRPGAEHVAWLFLDSDLDDAKAVWSGSRHIGAGGFGKTVLYTGHDQTRGEQIDSLVVKNIDEYSPDFDVWKYPGLHKEAAILSDVNKQDPNCRTNFLRRFTFNEANRRQRLYLEFCPHGDVNRIRSRYMLYDQWLPELWVWCIFEQLCEGLLVLQQPAHLTTVMAGHGETWTEDPPEKETMYVIHCDLKPDNILACDGNGKDPAEVDTASYPEAQLGDFGVAHYDFADNSDNPSSIRGGTKFYRPPEDLEWRATGPRTWDPPPNEAYVPVGKKFDVWCVGRIMFDLVTNMEPSTIQRAMDDVHLSQEEYFQRGHHFLRGTDWLDLFNSNHIGRDVYDKLPYTERLRELVTQALRPETKATNPVGAKDAENVEGVPGGALDTGLDDGEYIRPSVQTLIQDVRQGKANYIRDLKEQIQQRQQSLVEPPATRPGASWVPAAEPQTWEEATRLYFRGNEINAMEVGNAAFPVDYENEEKTARNHNFWGDPDWPELRIPKFPNMERPARVIVPDKVVDRVLTKLKPENAVIDITDMDTKFFEQSQFVGFFEGIAGTGAQPPPPPPPTPASHPPARTGEDDYTSMTDFDILTAIDKHPQKGTINVNELRQEGRGGLLRIICDLDGVAQPAEAVPSKDEYERHYLKTLQEELKKRDQDSKAKKKADIIRRLMELDAQGTAGDGWWSNQKEIPECSRRIGKKGKRAEGEEIVEAEGSVGAGSGPGTTTLSGGGAATNGEAETSVPPRETRAQKRRREAEGA